MSQHPSEPESALHILRQFRPKAFFPGVEMGIRFYSRLHTRPTPHETPQLGQMAPVLGFASLIVGALPVLTLVLAYWIGLPPLLAAALVIGAQVLVTGAMAEDALADSADGLFGGKTPERRLEIMKDPRHGTYGVLAIVLLIAIRLTALGSLLASSEGGAVLLWLGAQIGARQGALWLVLALPSARAAGLAQSAGALSGKAFWTGGIISGAMIILITAPFLSIVGIGVSVAVMALIIWSWSRACKNLAGGYSGDLIGALQALLEIAALSTFILFI